MLPEGERKGPKSLFHKITNVPVVYMGRDVWIWKGGNPFFGPFEGVCPEISTFLGPTLIVKTPQLAVRIPASDTCWQEERLWIPNGDTVHDDRKGEKVILTCMLTSKRGMIPTSAKCLQK
jgi:hypothetical protein